MKMTKKVLVIGIAVIIAVAIGCATKPKVKVVELENKGTPMGIATPDWIKDYTTSGITKVQAYPQYKDKYCVIGEESGLNKQFVLAWADNFSAQQRIGAMLRTNIASEYQARVQGNSQSTGGANSSTAAGGGSSTYQQQIDSVINAVVNVSYSGAQRDSDWWSLRRRYDPDQKDVFSDEYTAYVLYTIPKAELNRQIAYALETAVKADSALYQITIDMAKAILENGMADWGKGSKPIGVPADDTQPANPIPAASRATIANGTYSFSPRLQAKKAGVLSNTYLDRIVIDGKYMIFYMNNVPRGVAGGPEGRWDYLSDVVLTDLDNPKNVWKPIRGVDVRDPTGLHHEFTLSFEDVTIRHFKLENFAYPPVMIFEDITIPSQPDKQ